MKTSVFRFWLLLGGGVFRKCYGIYGEPPQGLLVGSWGIGFMP